MSTCPALMVAAPASGQGKTTVVAALARLHVRAGRKVRVFKCGPDFLDPQIHALASGQPCENIDFHMSGEEDARWRLARAARDNDLILVEGVMGLSDDEPSAAELARRLGLPILLVLNASTMAGTRMRRRLAARRLPRTARPGARRQPRHGRRAGRACRRRQTVWPNAAA